MDTTKRNTTPADSKSKIAYFSTLIFLVGNFWSGASADLNYKHIAILPCVPHLLLEPLLLRDKHKVCAECQRIGILKYESANYIIQLDQEDTRRPNTPIIGIAISYLDSIGLQNISLFGNDPTVFLYTFYSGFLYGISSSSQFRALDTTTLV